MQLGSWIAYVYYRLLKLREKNLRQAMTYRQEASFDTIESALEYVNCLLETTTEAHDHIKSEIERSKAPQLTRRREALQLVLYKLGKLSSHISASKLILNDLRTLRRLLLQQRENSRNHTMASTA
jgi:hypothetical protein